MPQSHRCLYAVYDRCTVFHHGDVLSTSFPRPMSWRVYQPRHSVLVQAVQSRPGLTLEATGDVDRDVGWVGNFTLRRTAILKTCDRPLRLVAPSVVRTPPPPCDGWLGYASSCRRRVELRVCRRRAHKKKLLPCAATGRQRMTCAESARETA